MTAQAPPILIDDVDDPRIAVFAKVKERDSVGRDGVFIAEGATVLNVLLCRSRIDVLAILVERGRVERLAVLQHRGAAPLYAASQKVVDAIAGFHLHRGILAAGRIPPSADLGAILSGGPVRLPVLVGLSNHDNVGGIYRNAAAFGAAAVVVDPQTADPFYRKAIRVGVGAPLVVPTVRANAAEALAALRAANVTPYALSPGADHTLGAMTLAPRAAFFLGTEGAGLPDAVMAAAEPLRIAIADGFDSLNVAATSAIVLNAHAERHGIGR
ncbi:MAG: TrmH family RNA methyltransferase [Pseudomonadota bacterium]